MVPLLIRNVLCHNKQTKQITKIFFFTVVRTSKVKLPKRREVNDSLLHFSTLVDSRPFVRNITCISFKPMKQCFQVQLAFHFHLYTLRFFIKISSPALGMLSSYSCKQAEKTKRYLVQFKAACNFRAVFSCATFYYSGRRLYM